LSAESERLLVSIEGKEIGEIETVRCDGILLFGGIEITTPAITLCVRKGIPVSFLTESGSRLKARILPAGTERRFRRQYALLENSNACLALARSTVRAKLEASLAVVEDYSSNLQPEPPEVAAAREVLSEALPNSDSAPGIPELNGIEGAAAASYFRAFGPMLGSVEWPGRTGRGAADPVNALLNLAYSLVVSELTARLDAAGLDPDAGFMHADRPGRPSLALDLMEPLRPALCDRFVLSAFNRREVNPENDFENTPEGLRLNRAAFHKVLKKWEARQKEVMPGTNPPVSNDAAIAGVVDSFLKTVLHSSRK